MTNPASGTLDLQSLKNKYAEEREKRVRVANRGEYTSVRGTPLAGKFDVDIWATTDGSREPVARDFDAVIVGGGFAGIIAAGKLRAHGVAADRICIVERGSDFGGTWYWNRYPGLACDTESYCYLPLLEETGYVPKEKYSHGPELFEHSKRLGRYFDLYDKALFQTRVTDAEWCEESWRWIVRTDRGDELRAQFLWLCAGATNHPKLPGIPGIEDFRGHSFHTMRWDYRYTGGSPEEPMTGLADKRVGIIGTGCSAVQCVPPLGESAKELYVFQRTPSAVNIRANRLTDPEWAAAQPPGWQMERMENFLNVIAGVPEEVDLVDDAWTWSFKNVRRVFEADKSRAERSEDVDLADFLRMEEVRSRVEATVRDKATAAALKPWYGVLCKRPTFHDGFLETFNRPNVTLVDTQGAGVGRITRRGVIANGREYELDCIIFSTGFDLSAGIAGGMGFDPRGVDGLRLSDRLSDAFTTLHGIHISGFPNMFLMGFSQGTLATTRTYDITVQTEQCASIMAYCRENGIQRAEVRPAGEAAWQRELADKRVDHGDYFDACTPGYLNLEGKGDHVYNYYYGAGPVAYRRELERWLAERMQQDMAFDRPAP
jgi:cyclohexanone monooxygenase